jgi:hypothetical protein
VEVEVALDIVLLLAAAVLVGVQTSTTIHPEQALPDKVMPVEIQLLVQVLAAAEEKEALAVKGRPPQKQAVLVELELM